MTHAACLGKVSASKILSQMNQGRKEIDIFILHCRAFSIFLMPPFLGTKYFISKWPSVQLLYLSVFEACFRCLLDLSTPSVFHLKSEYTTRVGFKRHQTVL